MYKARVIVTTTEKHNWLLSGFAYLFNIYWSTLQWVYIVGDVPPKIKMPENFHFYSMADEAVPADQWSEALSSFLEFLPDEIFVLLLPDYWICRKVDHIGIDTLAEYMKIHKDVLRLDLTTDRLYAGGMFDVEAWGHYDIIETPHGTPYQMSLQAGIWNKKLMLEVLEPGMNPWRVEIETSPPEAMRVLGTRQSPIRYANILKDGKVVKEEIEKLPADHKKVVSKWLP